MKNKKHEVLVLKLNVDTLMIFTLVINMLITEYSRFVKGQLILTEGLFNRGCALHLQFSCQNRERKNFFGKTSGQVCKN